GTRPVRTERSIWRGGSRLIRGGLVLLLWVDPEAARLSGAPGVGWSTEGNPGWLHWFYPPKSTIFANPFAAAYRGSGHSGSTGETPAGSIPPIRGTPAGSSRVSWSRLVRTGPC